MKKITLLLVLWVAKLTGLFYVARRLTAKDVRILCYHGIALRDEHRFSPGLFMSKETFAERMAYLARQRYRVISLDEALEGLKNGTSQNSATVITIDDGWYGTFSVMGPLLHNHGFPATLYIASYYLEKQVPVFNIATNYALWHGRGRVLNLSRVSDKLAGTFELADQAQRVKAHQSVIEFARSLEGAGERQSIFRKLCQAVDLDWRKIEEARICCFMNSQEARELLASGVDIQLHTHRHRFGPETFGQAQTEIADNRQVLACISDRPLRHFCYPSGYHNEREVPWLKRLDIESAVTIKSGFNRSDASAFELRRFLDSERITQLEFEAEMSGFFELIRRCGISI